MSALEDYPKTCRNSTAQLRALLEQIPDHDSRLREDIARSINGIADKACDLEDIFQRLLAGPKTPDEFADLLAAFEMTLEQIRGDSGSIDGQLYELSDRLRDAKTT